MKKVLRAIVMSGLAAGVASVAMTSGAVLATRTVSHSSPNAADAVAARNALVSSLRHSTPTARFATNVSAATSSSFNWEGYYDSTTTSGAFTKVGGAWKVPAVTCNAEDQIVSQWVGIDGATTSTVEQVGTLEQCFQGTAHLYSWYQMYPAQSSSVLVGTTVAAGDVITASVTRSGTSYTLKLTDATHTANNISTTQTCAATTCLDESAEWIVERPSFSIGIAPLAKFATFSQTNGTATKSGVSGHIGSFSPTSIDMVDATNTYNLATPGSLSSGKKFSNTWHNSY